MTSFSLETFIGLHIYLISADLIFGILDSFIQTISKNFLIPVINTLLGRHVNHLKFQIGKTEDDVIDLGSILKEIVRLFIIIVFIYITYIYFSKYKKYNGLKK